MGVLAGRRWVRVVEVLQRTTVMAEGQVQLG